MAEIASLKVSFGADDSGFQRVVKNMSTSLQGLGKNLEQTGATLSKRLTAPLVALGGVAVRAFGIQEDAERKLRAALEANGREVDRLFDRYNRFAKEMQRVTVIGDEATLAMLQQAETMGLTGDAAERAVKNSIAMQSAFGVSAERALRYTAALEEGNATMLRRYIPALRGVEDEAKMAAMAHEILGNAFSVAESEAQGTRGQIIQLKNAVGDLLEVIGGIIAEAITPFIAKMKELAEGVQAMDRDTLKLYVTVGLLTAAIGPLMIVLGKLVAALAAVMTPLAAKIALILSIVWALDYVRKNFSAFAEFYHRQWIMLKNNILVQIAGILEGIQTLVSVIPGVSTAVGAAVQKIFTMIEPLPKVQHEFQSLGEYLSDWKEAIRGIFQNISDIIFPPTEEQKIGQTMNRVALHFESAADRIERAMGRIRTVAREDGSVAEIALRGVGSSVIAITEALKSTMTDAAASFADSFGKMIASGMQGQSFFNMLLGIVADFASQFGRIVLGIGVAALQLQPVNLFSSPARTIAAGAALIALGGALRALVSAGPGGYGGGGSAPNFQPFATSVQAGGTVEFRIGYDSLVGVLDTGRRNQARAAGRVTG